MIRISCALVALFLCLIPAAAQTCVSVDSLLEKVSANKREYRVIEPGPVLDRLRNLFAETPPAGEPPPATRAVVVDLPGGVIVVYVVQDLACTPLVIGNSPDANEVRLLVFGARI